MTNGLCEHAKHCDFLRARAEIKNLLCGLASNAKIWEHEQASTRLNLRAPIQLNGVVIERVSSYKLLGVITNDLSWNEHCDSIHKKSY